MEHDNKEPEQSGLPRIDEGVDTLNIQPRKLRTEARLAQANPTRVISKARQQTFDTLDQSIKRVQNTR